jgi:hypothetical protein
MEAKDEAAETIPETFLGVGYTRDRAGLLLEAGAFPSDARRPARC